MPILPPINREATAYSSHEVGKKVVEFSVFEHLMKQVSLQLQCKRSLTTYLLVTVIVAQPTLLLVGKTQKDGTDDPVPSCSKVKSEEGEA